MKSISLLLLKQRVLTANTKAAGDSVYTPKGIADEYEDYLALGFDDYRIWEYELTDAEAASVEADFNKGIWQKPTETEYEDIINTFFENGLDRNKPDKLSEKCEDIFYCLYDNSLNEFIGIDEGAVLGWHRELFIYDKANKIYVAVFKGI